jgi:hypothetical protein
MFIIAGKPLPASIKIQEKPGRCVLYINLSAFAKKTPYTV